MARITLGEVGLDLGPRRELRLSGTQSLVRQDIPGAGPYYQDMGPDEEPISWDGVIDGGGAVETAQRLEGLRAAGQAVDLVAGLIPAVRVRIRSFEYRVIRRDRVEYSVDLVREVAVPTFTPEPETEPDAEAAPPVSQTHVVAAGDTLWALSLRYLGSGDQWPALAAANGITDPTTLQVGQVLNVPAAGEVDAVVAQYTEVQERRNTLARALVFINQM